MAQDGTVGNLSEVELFSRSWSALHAAVMALPAAAFDQPSGCAGWLVRDLVCHLVIDAQDVLITLATPAEGEPTANASTYWRPEVAPVASDPLDALIRRLAAAYEDPGLLTFHLDDVGSAAGRAARLADPNLVVGTKDLTLTVRDYLHAYVFEWTVHHLDLATRLADVPPPPIETLRAARNLLESIAGVKFPSVMSDEDALLVGTGRRAPTGGERELLGQALLAAVPYTLS